MHPKNLRLGPSRFEACDALMYPEGYIEQIKRQTSLREAADRADAAASDEGRVFTLLPDRITEQQQRYASATPEEQVRIRRNNISKITRETDRLFGNREAKRQREAEEE